MRLQIVSKLRRAASALRTAMLFAWLSLLIAAGALMLTVALIVATLAHAAFGWWGVAVVAAFVLAAIFGEDSPPAPTSPRRKPQEIGTGPTMARVVPVRGTSVGGEF